MMKTLRPQRNSQGQQDYDDDDDNELMNYFSGNTVILGRLVMMEISELQTSFKTGIN
jgi:hypothetical protein